MLTLQQLIAANRRGEPRGIYAICSAHGLVLEAAMEQAREDDSPLLIEATANQVNQFGGYTGMTPADFRGYVTNLAEQKGLSPERILLGGDHLGPVCWQTEPAAQAMEKARALIAAYVAAGFGKIHLDCSMPCSDDPLPLADEVIAARAADLCRVAEQTAVREFGRSDIVYVVGTEVPPPGGAKETISSLQVTDPARAKKNLDAHCEAFLKLDLGEAWQRVIGLVVQPGVEFDHTSVVDYRPEKAERLKALIPEVENIAFEAHSTDYQTQEAYNQLVRDHFAILKVGPQLTFALREALFALSHIEEQLPGIEQKSALREVCEQQMLARPDYWQSFYSVSKDQQPLYRRFSYSDRIRYYWPDEKVKQASAQLLDNLETREIPLPLISQYLPEEYREIRNGRLDKSASTLIKARIRKVTASYAQACWKQ